MQGIADRKKRKEEIKREVLRQQGISGDEPSSLLSSISLFIVLIVSLAFGLGIMIIVGFMALLFI